MKSQPLLKNQKPLPDQVKFFEKNRLVLPRNAWIALAMIKFTEENPSLLPVMQKMHADFIGLELDSGYTITHVRSKSMTERLRESAIRRKCPFAVSLRSNTDWVGGSCLSDCVKDGVALWQPSVPLVPQPQIDEKKYGDFRSELKKSIQNHFEAWSGTQSVWRSTKGDSAEGDFTLQCLMQNDPSDQNLRLIVSEIEKLHLPEGVQVWQSYFNSRKGIVSYRLKIKLTPFLLPH